MAIILGIETSCDETGIAILQVPSTKYQVPSGEIGEMSSNFKILGEELASSVDLQKEYGGVVPELASRVHTEKICTLIKKCLKKAELDWKDIDGIAVANGPGLVGALLVGVMTAKTLGMVLGKPLIAVNHLEGHISSSFLDYKKEDNFQFSIFNLQTNKEKFFKKNQSIFPMLILIVSGGHTELVVMRDWSKYEVIGSTIDDAVGEAFDKVAKVLGLPYPGGPSVSREAEEVNYELLITNYEGEKVSSIKYQVSSGERENTNLRRNNRWLEFFDRFEKLGLINKQNSAYNTKDGFLFPLSKIDSGDFDFSFSGLKTSVLYFVNDYLRKSGKKKLDKKFVQVVAYEFQKAAVEVLVRKTIKAMEKFGIQRVSLVGGVAANKRLREELKLVVETAGGSLVVPEIKYCTDNGVKIAVAGAIKYEKGEFTDWRDLEVDGNMELGE